jgi:hypothetical protein
LEERDNALRQLNIHVLWLGAALTVAGIVIGLVQPAREVNTIPNGQSSSKNSNGSVAMTIIIVGLILLLRDCFITHD